MIGERVPNVGEHVRFFLKGHLGFEVCVFLPRAHFRVSSAAAAAALVLLFFADPLPIRQRCSSPALNSHRNLKSGEYVCAAAMFCFLFFFCSVFFGFLGGVFFFFFLLHFLSFPFFGCCVAFFLSALKCDVSVFCESPIFFWVGGCLDFCDLRRNSGRCCFGEEFFLWRFL
jgi:hypothetical protein